MYILIVFIILVFVIYVYLFFVLFLGFNYYGIVGYYVIRVSEEGFLVYIIYILR